MNGLLRLLRAPIFWAGLLISAIPAFAIFASVSVGGWCEAALVRIGYRAWPRWLPLLLGVALYAGAGVALPAYVGAMLAGWVGGVAGPLAILAVIAWLDRW